MNSKHVFWGLVIVDAILFAIIYAVSGNYPLAALAFGLGVIWLAADTKSKKRLGTPCFLAYVVLAVIANLNNILIPLTLLGMSVNLAAWDMSRFRSRLVDQNGQVPHPLLEARHLHLLAAVICFGFLIALVPLYFRLTIPFVLVGGVTLLTLLTLQQSMRSLWMDHDRHK